MSRKAVMAMVVVVVTWLDVGLVFGGWRVGVGTDPYIRWRGVVIGFGVGV